MLNRIMFVCLFLALCTTGSALRCSWMENEFRQLSKKSLDLIDTMSNNSTSTTEDAEDEDAEYEDTDEEDETVAFPNDLYSQASKASAVDKLSFTVQVLEEVLVLFKRNHNSTSWQKSTVENLITVVTREADGLHSCIGSHMHKKKNKKLHMYFKRLSHHVLQNKDHSAEAWELIRKEITSHLLRTDVLVSSLLKTN
ncbi:interferon a3-like [Channa argus]|uniref:interferon a3-like n=1 Tax=Channa argus TaxID=215402 RepID=UPI0035212588